MKRNKHTIIFDIDGTLADITHRRKFLKNVKPDWKSFNQNMGEDIINYPIVELYQTLWNKILFVVDDRDQTVNMWRNNGITCLQCDKGDF